MAEQEMIRTSTEMRHQIVCPLTLKIAIASGGRLGAVQSYRCMPKPNKGGWETRPQNDKWASDFFKVINAGVDEEVTLSDGKTKMFGIDRPSDTRLEFPHSDGVAAKAAAIKVIKAGRIRAPRNWDKVFAEEAGMTLEALKNTFPELYATSSRTAGETAEPETPAESLGLGFDLADDEVSGIHEGESAIGTEPLDDEDEDLISHEEEEFDQEHGTPSYSVLAELEMDENELEITVPAREGHITIPRPASGQMMTLHAGCLWIRADMGGEYVHFYKVVDPKTGKKVWAQEGTNPDLSHINLTVKEV